MTFSIKNRTIQFGIDLKGRITRCSKLDFINSIVLWKGWREKICWFIEFTHNFLELVAMCARILSACMSDNYAYQKNNRHFYLLNICETKANKLQCGFIWILPFNWLHRGVATEQFLYYLLLYCAQKYNDRVERSTMERNAAKTIEAADWKMCGHLQCAHSVIRMDWI